MPLVVILVCIAGVALSMKSILVLGRHAPWTSTGWWLTILYFAVVFTQVVLDRTLPGHAEYILLVVLTVAFIIAGIRDEPQAEVWWWPTKRGTTRAQKRVGAD